MDCNVLRRWWAGGTAWGSLLFYCGSFIQPCEYVSEGTLCAFGNTPPLTPHLQPRNLSLNVLCLGIQLPDFSANGCVSLDNESGLSYVAAAFMQNRYAVDPL